MSAINTVRPIDQDTIASTKAAAALRPQIQQAVARVVAEVGPRNVFFVGAGGSLICSYPAAYLLTRHGDLPVFQMQSDEFNTAPPAALGEGSLVVLASYTGTTPETVAAAATAKQAGATVIVAAKDDSPLANNADQNFPAKSDLFELIVAFALLEARGLLPLNDNGVEVTAETVWSSIEAVPDALVDAALAADDKLAQVAEKFQQDPITYVLGSGPNYAWAYGMAMCYLQEMQWMHAAGYDAGEFFQGAFEMVDDTTAVLLWLAEDASRPVAERAARFLKTYAARAEYVDTADLALPGVAPQMRPHVTPLVVGALASRLAQHYEAVRDHDLKTRRYMFLVDY